MKKNLKYCSIFFVVLLFMPMVQRAFKIFPSIRLYGTFEKVQKPKWKWKDWMDGSYQSKYEEYYNQRQGMRSYLIRVYNQFHYVMHGTAPDTGGTVIEVGLDNYLYEQSYVELYNRTNKYTEEDMRATAARVKRLQDEFVKMGIGFVLIISPSKVEIYPEHVQPGRLKPGRDQRQSTYDVLIPLLREAGVDMIDGKALFREWKETLPYPLYARTGTHWNYIGAGKIVNIMMERLGRQLNRQLPTIELETVVVDDKIYGSDNDLGELMNIWTVQKLAGPQYHPVFKRLPGDGGEKPNLLFVGDSFSHVLVDLVNKNDLCTNTDLYFYFKRWFDSPEDIFGTPIRHSKLDWQGDIFKRDAVIFQINEYWLPKIGFGFMDNAFKALGVEEKKVEE